MRWDSIPVELRQLNQWVCAKNGSKQPMIAGLNAPASTSKPSTWRSFEEATKSVERGEYDYIGFVFADNGIVGIDIDDGYKDDGTPTELAQGIIDHTVSYTEVSKSGRGFHIIVKGDLPFGGRNNRGGVEIYKTGRYFILTADSAFGVVQLPLVECQQGIDWILKTHFPEIRMEGQSDRSYAPTIYKPRWDCKKGEKFRIRPHYPDITPGSRNICLTSLAGMLKSLGYNRGQILKELLYVNKVACKPPIAQREIEMIIRSVMRYRR